MMSHLASLSQLGSSSKFVLLKSPSTEVKQQVPVPKASEHLIGLKAGSKKRVKARRGGSSLPPSINVVPTFRHVYRYIAQDASATVKTVTIAKLVQSFGSVAIATTQLGSVITSFKLRRITIYPSSATGGSIPYVEWSEASSAFTKDERKNVSVPSGITVERPLRVSPPKGTLASFWLSSLSPTAEVFNIAATVGSIVDVDVMCTLAVAGTQYQETGYSGLTVGQMYYPSLDGRATNDFAPVDLLNAT
jgi:hypothetical protein